jgi:hypothetical protein
MSFMFNIIHPLQASRNRSRNRIRKRWLHSHLVEVLRPDDIERLHASLCRLQLLTSIEEEGKYHCEQTQIVSFPALCSALQLDQAEQDLCQPFFSFLNEESKQLSFPLFSFYLWNFCTLGESSLARLAFGVLSPTRSEVLCERHVLSLLKQLSAGAGNLKERCSDVYEALWGVKHNAHTFSLFCKEFAFFLHPLRRVQDKLRHEILGESFWRRLTLGRAVGGAGRGSEEE